jgi:hypothetical protein
MDVHWGCGVACGHACNMHFKTDQSPAGQLAFKAKRVDLVAHTGLTLALASEAEKSAVLAITDKDSQTFADQARAATAEVERERKELGELLTRSGTSGEKDLFVQLSKAFDDFQRIDNGLLGLAVKNTNIGSLALSLGQKRNVSLLCQDILSALQQAILKEPIAGVNYESMSNPRSLEVLKPETGK